MKIKANNETKKNVEKQLIQRVQEAKLRVEERRKERKTESRSIRRDDKGGIESREFIEKEVNRDGAKG